MGTKASSCKAVFFWGWGRDCLYQRRLLPWGSGFPGGDTGRAFSVTTRIGAKLLVLTW